MLHQTRDPSAGLFPPGPLTSTLKGPTVQAIGSPAQTVEYWSDGIYCGDWNMVSVQAIPTGETPQATITLEGASESGGPYLPLADAQGTKTLTVADSFDAIVGAHWIRVHLSAVTGTYAAGQGWTIWLTPYVGSGQPNVITTLVVSSLSAITVNTGALSVSDWITLAASGGIYQGTGTPASPTTGLKIWNDGGIGRIAGYNGGTLQWGAGTDGKLYAGAGVVSLDATGVKIAVGSALDPVGSYQFTAGGTIIGYTAAWQSSVIILENDVRLSALSVDGYHSYAAVTSTAPSGKISGAILSASTPAQGATSIDLISNNIARYVAIGDIDYIAMSVSGSSPASSGFIRIPVNQWITSRNNAGSGNVNVISLNTSDRVAFGADLESFSANGTCTFKAIPTIFSASNAGLEIGNTGAANTPFIDFHSSGNNIDHDARIIASGGSGSVGQGALQFLCASMGFYGTAVATKQAVTGSRGGNVALASLLTALATIGLITDSSSA